MPEADLAYEGLQVHFLMKPCEPEELIQTIKKALDGNLSGNQKRAS
jgi:DNA-binding NtrC family response regulator